MTVRSSFRSRLCDINCIVEKQKKKKNRGEIRRTRLKEGCERNEKHYPRDTYRVRTHAHRAFTSVSLVIVSREPSLTVWWGFRRPASHSTLLYPVFSPTDISSSSSRQSTRDRFLSRVPPLTLSASLMTQRVKNHFEFLQNRRNNWSLGVFRGYRS